MGTPSRWSRSTLLVLAIVVFAAAARLTQIAWDQHHFFHPDERAVAGAVMRLSFKPLQLNPQFFAYGSLPIYLDKLVTSALSYVDPAAAGYDSVILNGRRMTAVIGSLTVLLLIGIGSRLYDRTVGLLAGFLLAACPLHLQNSRFLTVDVTLTFFVLLALSQMVRASLDGRAIHFVLSGMALGFATASKFSAMPLFVPLGIAALHRWWVEGRFLPVAGRTMQAVVAALAAFALAQPYAILDYRAFIHDIFEQSQMVRTAGVFPYTVQYMGTPKYWYELTQLVTWGMAPALGVAAVWATVMRVGVAWRTRRAEEWILLSWLAPFFLITGWFEVKFPRYLLPIYPIMILWAAEWLVRHYRRGGVLRRLAAPVVAAGTLAAAFAFMSIYTRPHTVVTASEWVYRHVPSGSTILSQHWDEGFPFALPNRSPAIYKVVEFGYYEADNPAKIQNLSTALAEADYIALQTKRLYGAVTRAPQRFPLTTNYFYQLFAGDLGYTLVHEVASRPSLFGIEFPDEIGDESLSVYDHPKVLIFQNTEHLPANLIADKILHGLPSRPLTRDDLLLARPQGEVSMETTGAAPPIRSSLLALVLFAALVEILALAAYPVARTFLVWPGTLSLAKVLGILLFAYLSWLGISLRVATFTQGTLTALVAGLALVGWLMWRRGGHTPHTRAEVVATEALFWGVFMFFLGVRAFNPEVFWGEKPMDFSFLNALTRATTLPPPEPWFAGSPLQYNYFGHYIVAALGKTVHLDPALTFNLGIAVMGALTATAAFSVGSAITSRWQTGLLAACLVTLAGNLAGVREASRQHTALTFDYFWATSRVIKNTINEFPLWSFLFADLHAHVMVIPVSLTFMCLVVLWVRTRLMRAGEAAPSASGAALFVLMCFLLGTILVTNTWSAPTYVLLLPFLLGALWLTEGGYQSVIGLAFGTFTRVLLPTVAVVGGAYVLYFPFWKNFVAPERNFGWERGPEFAPPFDFLTIFGLYLFVLIPLLYALWLRNIRRADGSLGTARMVIVLLAVAVLPAALAVSTRAFCCVLFLLGLQLLVAPQTESRWRIPLALATFAFAITTGCDLVYVWDRMNTIFKFYLEAWSMLAIAAAVAVPALWSGSVSLMGIAPRAGRRIWQLGMLALAGLALFTAVTDVIGVIRTNRVISPKPSLNGMAYLRNRVPDEAAAYEWLNRHIQGIPVLLEAHGDSYQEFTRVSMNTGLPTVLGWGYHVFQRGQPWVEIHQRKADIETVYSSADKQAVASILQRYHVALIYLGPLERRTYAGANLTRFREWTDLLTPIYQNPGVTIFAVNGRFTGTMPVTTIEDIPRLAAEEARGAPEEARPQFPAGRLHQPRGVAVAGDGTIFVADFGNNRVQVFAVDMSAGRAWGTRGEGPGQFKDPCGIAVGPSGEVFVADTWNQRVQAFSKDGDYLREWGSSFFGPRGIAVDAKGRVFVADTGNGRVLRFSAAGQREIEWGKKGDKAGEFFEPTGLAVDAAGKVYVADNGNGRLQIFTADGQFVSEFAVSGWESKVYSEPHVAIDARGTIWVTVATEKEVRNYDGSGKLLRTIKGTSVPGVAFEMPMGVAYSAAAKALIITDLENRIVRMPLP
jgi:YYY domain-containing protein